MLFLSSAGKLAGLVYEFKPQANKIRTVLVFSVFALFLPVILSVIVSIIEPRYGDIYRSLSVDPNSSLVTGSQKTMVFIYQLLTFLLPLLGLVVHSVLAFSTLLKGGYVFCYLFFIIPGLISLFGASALVVFWLSNAINVVMLLLAFVFIPGMRLSLLHLLKPKKLLLIIVAALVIYGLTFALNVGGSMIFPTTADNEAQIRKLSFVQQFVSAVLIAPFVEEFLIRRTIYKNYAGALYGNLIGAVVSCFFFAFLHIQATNDWKHILSYLLPSIPLTLGLIVFRNALPSSFGHLFSNLTILLVN